MFPADRSLRVLQVHNRHAPGWGGEETVVDLEARLLEKWGHTVELFQVSNASLKHASVIRQMLAVPGFLWSQGSYRTLRQTISRFTPDVVHVHNSFPLLSPSVFWAAEHEGVPAVQTLHNFRHACANNVLLRNDRPCEDCVGSSSWPGLRHRCYANSFVRTAAVLAMNALHWKLGTYTGKVGGYIALNEFSRDILVRAGLPGGKMTVKPNFVPASSLVPAARSSRVVFAGSMTRHKGLHVLLDAWRRVHVDGSELILIGDGPEREALQTQFRSSRRVSWTGSLSHPEVLRCIGESRALVLPTLAYENCPMVLLEAFSAATPVIVPDLGSMKTMVSDESNGLIFDAANSAALANVLQKVLRAPSDVWSLWSAAAQRAHERLYSETTNYRQLIAIYRSVIEAHAEAYRLKDPKRVPALTDTRPSSVPFEAD
jgi:glycosyltransferase involved in cell wall biosynthesis